MLLTATGTVDEIRQTLKRTRDIVIRVAGEKDAARQQLSRLRMSTM